MPEPTRAATFYDMLTAQHGDGERDRAPREEPRSARSADDVRPEGGGPEGYRFLAWCSTCRRKTEHVVASVGDGAWVAMCSAADHKGLGER